MREQEAEFYAGEIEALTEKVRAMIVSGDGAGRVEEKLNLIEKIERLGIGYHFAEEIEEQVLNFHGAAVTAGDLNTVALTFRLLRQHGHRISSGIFQKFIGDDGGFKESIKGDARGLLSLYEAANLRTHGEDILDKALTFATGCLESMAPKLRSPLKDQVTYAMDQSFHRGIPRVEAYRFISFYEDEEHSKDDPLLRLAKLDFNLLQILHRKELSELTRWWKNLGLVSKLSYARDRVVECYFWTLGVYFEPQYSQARIILAKTIAMVSVIDDTYDSYGTIDELQIFTEAIQRWDINEVDRLPDYMKILYSAVLDLYDQYEEELSHQGRSFAVDYAKSKMKEIARSYNVEAKWFIEGFMPSFDEYMSNGFITSTYYLLAATSFVGIDYATKQDFDWLKNKPKIQVANVTICRVVDDIATYDIEKKRGQSVTGIECYMKDYGVCEEEAMEAFQDIAENGWKDINKELVDEKSVSIDILTRVVNLSRLIDVVYKHNQDGYTHPEKLLKPLITALLVQPLHL
nr:terpene synthase 21 [Andrographis paniculata]